MIINFDKTGKIQNQADINTFFTILSCDTGFEVWPVGKNELNDVKKFKTLDEASYFIYKNSEA